VSANGFGGIEVFGKGSVSKSYISVDKSTVSVSITGGLAFSLISNVRIEGRYTNISSLQNKLDVVSSSVIGTLSDIKTQTAIYSVGMDISFFGEKSAFQPFIYLGAGYIETERSYYFSLADGSASTFFTEPKQTGISANAGAGFRVRLARALAIEVEMFAYGIDIHKPNPLVNLYGTAGLRIFL